MGAVIIDDMTPPPLNKWEQKAQKCHPRILGTCKAIADRNPDLVVESEGAEHKGFIYPKSATVHEGEGKPWLWQVSGWRGGHECSDDVGQAHQWPSGSRGTGCELGSGVYRGISIGGVDSPRI